MTSLTRLLGRRSFRLPQFEVPALEFHRLAELILEEPFEPKELPANVVRLPRANPTAGELRDSIERHLQARDGDGAAGRDLSPGEELKNALAELRGQLR